MAESLAVARGFGITRAPFETYSKYARSPPLRSGGGLGRGRDKHHGTVQNTAAILSKTPTRPRWRARASTLRRARELRREPPPAERALWRCLRARQIGNFAFRQQHPIGPFIVDFYCARAKLVVEVDGDTHGTQEEYDDSRTRWLEQERGLRVVRFTDHDVLGPDAVLESIRAYLLVAPPP
jgi:very-short-patch-repair endonuclease